MCANLSEREGERERERERVRVSVSVYVYTCVCVMFVQAGMLLCSRSTSSRAACLFEAGVLFDGS